MMRKRFLTLLALAVLVLMISAQAVEARIPAVKPSLSFSGTTAYCEANCRSEDLTDSIAATLTLYQGTTYVDSWSDSGTGRAYVSGSCKVESGKSYKLVLSYSINGRSKPSVSTTATCP